MPPTAAASGDSARRGDASGPRQRGLEHFFAGQRKEEHHTHVVHPEVQRVGEVIVGVVVDVCPGDRGDGSREQQQ